MINNVNIEELRPRFKENGASVPDRSFPEIPPPGPKLDQYLEESNIPNVKSIRRLLFRNPGLLYYTKEIRFLFYHGLSRNIDYLRHVLQSDHAIRLMNLLHVYDSYRFSEAFKLYARLAGSQRVMRQLAPKTDWPYSMHELFQNIVRCANMDAELARKVYRSPEMFETVSYNDFFAVDVPVTLYGEIPDENRESYIFRQQRTTCEVRKLGKALNNCLAERFNVSHPVWGIFEMRDGAEIAIGAFQVKRLENGTYSLVQAHAARNTKLPKAAVKCMHAYLDQYMTGWRDRQFHISFFDLLMEQMAVDFDERNHRPIPDDDLL